MKYRKLRITWSVAWGVAAVLLVVLWVRSYSCRVNIQASFLPSRTFQCSLLPGRIYFRSYSLINAADRKEWITGISQVYKYRANVGDVTGISFDNWDYPNSPKFKFTLGEFRPGDVIIHFPYWAAFCVLASISLMAWYPWSKRFSLRALLAAMTLVALVLGGVMWIVRS